MAASVAKPVLHAPDGLLLTGVGVYDDPNLGGFHVPFDKDMRWSDAGFEPSDDNRVGQFRRLAPAGLQRQAWDPVLSRGYGRLRQ